MADQHYARAPIKEAILEVRLKEPLLVPVSALEHADAFSIQDFSKPSKVPEIQGELRYEADEPSGSARATSKHDDVGYRRISSDGKYVVVFRLDRFSISRLAPYETWASFRDKARDLWRIYRSTAPSMVVSRIALRYVNQLDIPLPIRDFRDFIRTYPEVSSDLPQMISGMFMQIMIPQQDIDAMLILNEALVPPASESVTSIVLDIDVFRDNLTIVDENEIWNAFEVLRVRKNDVFESCITNNTRRLFDPICQGPALPMQ